MAEEKGFELSPEIELDIAVKRGLLLEKIAAQQERIQDKQNLHAKLQTETVQNNPFLKAHADFVIASRDLDNEIEIDTQIATALERKLETLKRIEAQLRLHLADLANGLRTSDRAEKETKALMSALPRDISQEISSEQEDISNGAINIAAICAQLDTFEVEVEPIPYAPRKFPDLEEKQAEHPVKQAEIQLQKQVETAIEAAKKTIESGWQKHANAPDTTPLLTQQALFSAIEELEKLVTKEKNKVPAKNTYQSAKKTYVSSTNTAIQQAHLPSVTAIHTAMDAAQAWYDAAEAYKAAIEQQQKNVESEISALEEAAKPEHVQPQAAAQPTQAGKKVIHDKKLEKLEEAMKAAELAKTKASSLVEQNRKRVDISPAQKLADINAAREASQAYQHAMHALSAHVMRPGGEAIPTKEDQKSDDSVDVGTFMADALTRQWSRPKTKGISKFGLFLTALGGITLIIAGIASLDYFPQLADLIGKIALVVLDGVGAGMAFVGSLMMWRNCRTNNVSDALPETIMAVEVPSNQAFEAADEVVEGYKPALRILSAQKSTFYVER